MKARPALLGNGGGYSTKWNRKTKVLDFVQLGGPSWIRTRDLSLIRTAL